MYATVREAIIAISTRRMIKLKHGNDNTASGIKRISKRELREIINRNRQYWLAGHRISERR